MNWITKRLVSLVSPKYAKNWARHIVGAASQWLIMSGYLAPELADKLGGPAEAAVAGGILFLITVLVSIGNSEGSKSD
jgi:hypothetical protein